MPILDTNFLIRLDEDDPVAVRTLRKIDQDHLVVPYQAALEFACGTDDPEASLMDIDSTFTLERPEQETLEIAVRLIADNRKKNLRTQTGDAWIAASASLRADYVVTTNKRDFRALGIPAWHFENEERPPKK